MSDDDYRRAYVDTFDPDLFDPEGWAEAAYAAGMRYVVIVAKHHDGFCLWDSAQTDFTAPATAAGRDLLEPIIEAFRARGLRIGLYYSLLDWHHPDYTLDGVHPDRDAPEAQATTRDFSVYQRYMQEQVRELLTGFGRIDYMWFDFSYPHVEWTAPDGSTVPGKSKDSWLSEELEALCLELQPGIVLNDRLGLERGVATPEQNRPEAGIVDESGRSRLWELCDTHNGSWAYNRDDLAWKNSRQVATTLVDVVGKGGNLLFNVGPTPRGLVPERTRSLLDDLSAWMHWSSPAIHGAGASEFDAPNGCVYTQAGDRLFVTVLVWQQHLALPGLRSRTAWARTLDDGFEIPLKPHTLRSHFPDDDDMLVFELPMRPDVLLPVIELRLKAARSS